MAGSPTRASPPARTASASACIDTVLVAVSFSERSIDAVRQAARLAARHGAGLTLLHVVEPVKRLSVRRLPAQQALVEARATEAQLRLARLAGRIAATGRVPVLVRVDVGDKVRTIAKACEEADVLYIGGARAGRLAAAFHMTTPERLVRQCRIPVTVVTAAFARPAASLPSSWLPRRTGRRTCQLR